MSGVGDSETPPDGVGRSESDCGDLCVMHVWLRDGRVVRCEFEVRGCQNTLAAAAAAAAFARAGTCGEVLGFQPPDLLARLEGLPSGTEHVADLVLHALHEAVLDAFRSRREPWKRVYRRA
jgi:NifU-like protein involved in Fe-S cluster formation